MALGYTAFADRSPMHKFTYRTPRYTVDFPVQLALGEAIITGRCREISTDGMQLELRRPLPAGFCAWFASRGRTFIWNCRCAGHTGAKQDALRFIFGSEKERAAVATWSCGWRSGRARGSARPGVGPVDQTHLGWRARWKPRSAS